MIHFFVSKCNHHLVKYDALGHIYSKKIAMCMIGRIFFGRRNGNENDYIKQLSEVIHGQNMVEM